MVYFEQNLVDLKTDHTFMKIHFYCMSFWILLVWKKEENKFIFWIKSMVFIKVWFRSRWLKMNSISKVKIKYVYWGQKYRTLNYFCNNSIRYQINNSFFPIYNLKITDCNKNYLPRKFLLSKINYLVIIFFVSIRSKFISEYYLNLIYFYV